MSGLDIVFQPTRLDDAELALRHEVREFLRQEFPPGEYRPNLGFGGYSPDFSRRLAARGWVGMAIPREYGGQGRTAVERFIVVEELLRAGAPVGAHWIADRQSGPVILAFGTEAQRVRFLPAICRGECYFSIGMSEPDSGSDLASVRTVAEPVPGGWRLRGRKIWTSNAHLNQFAITLCRSSPLTADRHAGLSQFIVDLHSPGVVVHPVHLIDGSHHFNEVELDDVFVPDDLVLGQIGAGWRQVTSELTFERAGPDRYLSTFPLLERYVAERAALDGTVERAAGRIGRLGARLWTIRQLGLAIARAVDRGDAPAVQAALVKDLGTTFEQELVRVIGDLVDDEASQDSPSLLIALLAEAVLNAPAFTIRGGTTEVLRMIAARGLGVGR
jgi:alkylation response protein AidB-like acyl-CoA dehydrogenase